MNPTIRKVRKDDIQFLKDVLNSIELFPSEILEDLISDFFNNPETEEIWFTATENDIPISIGYCAPEKLTEGTFNLYAIGVKGDIQGKGIGGTMMKYLEEDLRKKGHRILIVETSGTDDFKLTRKFYENLDYSKEAVIRDFWKEGDDKVVYWKKLN
jgi:ribosomal protein S18 acetylase RimI-like enzyme